MSRPRFLDEASLKSSLVSNLAVGPEVWLFLTLLGCLTIFFKYSRFWSIRNLDLFLLFALTPGMMMLVGNRAAEPWIAYLFLFMGTFLWLARCLIDMGLARRPVLEPNLNAAGLACLSVGVLILFVLETLNLSVSEGAVRNPADANAAKPENAASAAAPPAPAEPPPAVKQVTDSLAKAVKGTQYQAIARVIACFAQLGLVVGLVVVGWKHYERPISGLAVATCYLLLPYARFALVDCGQLLPAALIVAALVWYKHPAVAGVLIGFSAAWMPASIGLVPLWTGFYRGKNMLKFGLIAGGVLVGSVVVGMLVPGMSSRAIALGARSLSEAGFWPNAEAPEERSFWSGIDSSYRLPVWIGYLALVICTTVWPGKKNLGQLISASAALLLASQFWYLASGGTLVLLYLPLVILMMFRPNLGHRRTFATRTKTRDSSVGVDAVL
jgi:hypothetical protein